jgi:ectoine hydroxylase-related dioxygenase (phytanoyl-CoA dioxygenase family)
MLPGAAPRAITDDEIDTFRREGVVCLRAVMPLEWLDYMAEPVEAALQTSAVADLSEMGDALTGRAAAPANTARGRFLAGTDHSRTQPEFFAFSVASPLAAIVAQLLGTHRVWLYEDSVLVKEPGTAEKTVFHQDMAYFHLDGDQVCTTWVPLDPVDAGNGAVQFVRGSHLRPTRFRPNLFVTSEPIPGTSGEIVPDFSQSDDLVSFDTEPGDITVHHARTIHGAHANNSATRRRRAISVRYAGDDAVYRVKPGAPRKPHHAALVEGRPLEAPACPQVWPVAERG